jgi:hypothetical protein
MSRAPACGSEGILAALDNTSLPGIAVIESKDRPEGRPTHHRSVELLTSVNGSLSPDSCCTGLVTAKAELGQKATKEGDIEVLFSP